jgi:hypothetical protein
VQKVESSLVIVVLVLQCLHYVRTLKVILPLAVVDAVVSEETFAAPEVVVAAVAVEVGVVVRDLLLF